jgi:hypothetical protein
MNFQLELKTRAFGLGLIVSKYVRIQDNEEMP